VNFFRRRRLQSKKAALASQPDVTKLPVSPAHKISSTESPTEKKIVSEIVEILSDVKKPAPVSTLILPTLPSDPPKKIMKELRGGVSSFFGEPHLVKKEEESNPVVSGKDITPNKKRVLPQSVVTEAKDSTPSLKSASSKLVPSSSKRHKSEPRLDIETATLARTKARSAEQCLEGLKIAITGVMNITGRDDLESMICMLGGKVASSVSSKTDFLVAGVLLEDNRLASESSKYKAAVERNVKIVREEEFLTLIQQAKATAASQTSHAPETNGSMKINGMKTKPEQSSIGSNNFISLHSSTGEGANERIEDEQNMLWVDKYKPKDVADIIGAGDTVKKLTDWLRNWEAMHIKKSLKPAFSKENPGAKAVLLSGPPG
jgi:hypothetical protein